MPEPKTYHRPEDIAQVLRLLVQKGQSGAILAGGTTLVPRLEDDVTDIIDLQAAGLDGIEVSEERVTLGAMTRLRSIVENENVPEAVRDAARYEGPNTLRNAGTIGGIVVAADWESELFAALLVYDAQVTVQTPGEVCDLALGDFDPAEYADGIVTQVTMARDGFATHERVARTPADRPIVAVVGRNDGSGAMKMAFCGVAARPLLLSLDELAKLDPPGDFRGSPTYRREMAIILADRVSESLA